MLQKRTQKLDETLSENRIRDALASVWPPIQTNKSVLLHGDFWSGNTLWKHGKLAGIIAWEDAGYGDPLVDLGNAGWPVILPYPYNSHYGIVNGNISMTERTVFQKIWDGDSPSYTLYRNNRYGLMAMLDIFPATPGHTLVVPQEAVDQWTDLPDGRLVQAILLGKFVGRHIQDVLQPLRVTRHTIGFGVPHIHDQYVPSYERGDIEYLHDSERMKRSASPEDLRAMEGRLRFPEELVEITDVKMAELAEAFDISPRQS